MKEVLVSGCNQVQYSYDAKIGNRYHGAMTYYALQSLEARPVEHRLQDLGAAPERVAAPTTATTRVRNSKGRTTSKTVACSGSSGGRAGRARHGPDGRCRPPHARARCGVHPRRSSSSGSPTHAAAPPAGYEACAAVRVDGVVAPGLIDLHNHLAYNTLPLWVGRPEAYGTRYQWPRAATYGPDVSNPAQALGHRRAGRRAPLRRGQGGRRRGHRDPRLTAAHAQRSRAGWCATSRTRSTAPVSASSSRCCPRPTSSSTATATHLQDGQARSSTTSPKASTRAARRVHAPRRSPLRPRRAGRHPLDGAHRCRLPPLARGRAVARSSGRRSRTSGCTATPPTS